MPSDTQFTSELGELAMSQAPQSATNNPVVANSGTAPVASPKGSQKLTPQKPLEEPSPDELALARKLVEAKEKLAAEVHKFIVGQDDVIEQLLLAIFCRGIA